MQKVISRPKAGTPRAKQLEELKEEENLRVLIRFKERNIKKYYKTVVG